MSAPPRLPGWAVWTTTEPAWTVGVEEEVMLLDPRSMALASRIDDVLPALSPALADRASAETHGSALELATRPHRTVGAAVADLEGLRGQLSADLRGLGLVAAVAGTHPFAQWQDTEISPGARYQSIYESMRELARREPTFALHVHVAVPDPADAVRALNGLRGHLPILLALSANSPFWQGRLTGLASSRIPVFGGFPRVGIPRYFESYADYAEAIDLLLRCGAFEEPTFLWWDARLQPKLGTLEVRIMDAQSRIDDVAALVGLVQCLVRFEAGGGFGRAEKMHTPEVLEENRFIASRDGMSAELLDPPREKRRPVRDWLEDLVEACEPHAAELGCAAELALALPLADSPGDRRQRAINEVGQGDVVGRRLDDVVRVLQQEFTALRTAALTA